MLGLVVVVVLATTVLIGTSLGGRYRVAPPVLLIVFGSLLGFIPALSEVHLDPDFVLFVFLPAILYRESLTTSMREIRANLRVISLTGIVLVIVTTVTTAYGLIALGVDSKAAWVLGAALAPTDAAAVAGLAKRMPRRTLTTLQAESLINDGTSLVLFALAVEAASHPKPVGFLDLTGKFVGSYAGGMLSGFAVALVVVWLRRRIDDPMREGAISVLTPFAAFLLAEEIHSSGVLAVVVAGLVMAYEGPRVVRARSRLIESAFWDQLTFLLNGSLFTLLGMQIPSAARDLDSTSLLAAIGLAFGATALLIGTRIAWVLVTPYIIRAIDRRQSQRAKRVGIKPRLASGWAGFRGAVSLAAALAVPLTLDSGERFPDRDLIVFVTSAVILITVLLQGTTLPAVMRWAGLTEDQARLDELELARRQATEAAIEAMPRIAAELGVHDELLERFRYEYEEHAKLILLDAESEDGIRVAEERELIRQLRLGVLEHKRQHVTAMRDRRVIDDIVLRELQLTLDIEELRLLGIESNE